MWEHYGSARLAAPMLIVIAVVYFSIRLLDFYWHEKKEDRRSKLTALLCASLLWAVANLLAGVAHICHAMQAWIPAAFRDRARRSNQ